MERRLYLYPESFSNITIARLLGDGVISDPSTTTSQAGRSTRSLPMARLNSLTRSSSSVSSPSDYGLHVDTTTFSVSCEYDVEFDSHDMTITCGHPKDGRWDLKQFVLRMAIDQHGIPLTLQTFSGNELNKKILLTIITQLTENPQQHPGNVYHIADAAVYTTENLAALGTHTFWISRVLVT